MPKGSDLLIAIGNALKANPSSDPDISLEAAQAAVVGSKFGRATDGDGYLALAEEGYEQDGVTRSCDDTELARRKALVEKHKNDTEYRNIEPRFFRFLVLRDLIRTEIVPGTSNALLPIAYVGQHDLPITLDSWAAENEGAGKAHTV